MALGFGGRWRRDNPPLMRVLPLLLLCCLLCAPLTAAAEEEKPSALTAAQRAEASSIGRNLISPDVATRRRASARLRDHIARGHDLKTFLEAMSDAMAEAANGNARLVEFWLDRAVNGSGAERARAMRLLAAFGPTAVRRLAVELERRQLDDATSASQKKEQDLLNAPAGVPRLYDVRTLLKREGATAMSVRNMIEKQADAVEVQQSGLYFIVTASAKGHERLRTHINRILIQGVLQTAQTLEAAVGSDGAQRETVPQEAALARQPKSPRPPPGQTTRSGATQAGPARSTNGLEAKGHAGARKPAPRPEAFERNEPTWLIDTTLLSFPRDGAVLSAWMGGDPAADAAGRAHTRIRLGTAGDAQKWAAMALQVPDARRDLPLRGDPTIRAKDVRATKGQGWRIVTGMIRHGLTLDLRVSPTHSEDGKGLLAVEATLTRTDVGSPMPVVLVHPSPRTAPVELDRPEWSTTRTQAHFSLPLEGGGALLALEGISSTPSEQLILILRIQDVGTLRK